MIESLVRLSKVSSGKSRSSFPALPLPKKKVKNGSYSSAISPPPLHGCRAIVPHLPCVEGGGGAMDFWAEHAGTSIPKTKRRKAATKKGARNKAASPSPFSTCLPANPNREFRIERERNFADPADKIRRPLFSQKGKSRLPNIRPCRIKCARGRLLIPFLALNLRREAPCCCILFFLCQREIEMRNWLNSLPSSSSLVLSFPPFSLSKFPPLISPSSSSSPLDCLSCQHPGGDRGADDLGGMKITQPTFFRPLQ